jgi:hypothetical protein
VLPGQGYQTPQEAMSGEYGAMLKWWIARENWRNSENNVLKCHFSHQDSYMKSMEWTWCFTVRSQFHSHSHS